MLDGTGNRTKVKCLLTICLLVVFIFALKTLIRSICCAFIEMYSVPQSKDKLACWFFQKHLVKNVSIILNNSIVFFFWCALSTFSVNPSVISDQELNRHICFQVLLNPLSLSIQMLNLTVWGHYPSHILSSYLCVLSTFFLDSLLV